MRQRESSGDRGLAVTTPPRLADYLVEQGHLSEELLDDVLAHSGARGDDSLRELLLQKGLVDEETLADALADMADVPFRDLRFEELQDAAVRAVPADIPPQRRVMPVSVVGDTPSWRWPVPSTSSPSTPWSGTGGCGRCTTRWWAAKPPGAHGYVGDARTPSRKIEDLVACDDQPSFEVSEPTGVVYGWNGSCIDRGRRAERFSESEAIPEGSSSGDQSGATTREARDGRSR